MGHGLFLTPYKSSAVQGWLCRRFLILTRVYWPCCRPINSAAVKRSGPFFFLCVLPESSRLQPFVMSQWCTGTPCCHPLRQLLFLLLSTHTKFENEIFIIRNMLISDWYRYRMIFKDKMSVSMLKISYWNSPRNDEMLHVKAPTLGESYACVLCCSCFMRLADV